jgi:hypothetical protein
MTIAATTDRLAFTHQSPQLRRGRVHPSRWWPAPIAAWQRRLDQQIENDLRWLGHAEVLEDFRRASHD